MKTSRTCSLLSALALCVGCTSVQEQRGGVAGAPVTAGDICTILSMATSHGSDDSLQGPRRELVFDRSTPGWRNIPLALDDGLPSGPWGRCDHPVYQTDSLAFDASGRRARTNGGTSPNDLQYARGACLFEKVGSTWALTGCAITETS